MAPKHGAPTLDAPSPVVSLEADPAVVSAMRVEQAARKAHDAATARLEGIDAVLNPPIPKRDTPAPSRDQRSIFEARKNLAAAQFDWNESGVALEEAKQATLAAREAAKQRVTIERRAEVYALAAELDAILDAGSAVAERILAHNDATVAMGGTPDRTVQFPWLHRERPNVSSVFAAWKRTLRDRGIM